MDDSPQPPEPASIALLIADDHEMIRLSLRQALAALDTGPGIAIAIVEAADGEGTLAQLRTAAAAGRPVDLALVDFMMPGVDGVAWFRALRTEFPALRMIVMSGHEDADLVRELGKIGVAGFIPKSDTARRMLLAIRIVLDGGTYVPLRLLGGGAGGRAADAAGRAAGGVAGAASLTERQTHVLELLAQGLPNKLIARKLGLSDSTVKVHLLAIYRAFGVSNRTEAAVAAARYFDPGD